MNGFLAEAERPNCNTHAADFEKEKAAASERASALPATATDRVRCGAVDVGLRQFVRLLMRYLRQILLYILKKIPLREVLVF